jgi:hypothetical protein
MVTEIIPLDQLVRKLPPDSQAKVREFVESLIEQQGHESSGHLRQSWAGALSDYRDQFTPVELQKRSLDWRAD